MTETYPQSGITRMANGTDIHWLSKGPGDHSSMIFTPEAKEALSRVEIKGVNFKDSSSRRKK